MTLPRFVRKPRRVWLLWLKSKAVGQRPSALFGLDPKSYVAYCLDEAVIYFGMALENKLETAGHKPSKEERRAQAAREKILDAVLADPDLDGVEPKKKTSGYADPAVMFN